MPGFRALDSEALATQNQFRLEQFLLIMGGILATLLGVLQTALAAARWPGIAESILASVLAALAMRSRTLNAQQRYLTTRLRAETLRGEYFLFLGRIGDYADEATRTQRLKRRVDEITWGKKSQ